MSNLGLKLLFEESTVTLPFLDRYCHSTSRCRLMGFILDRCCPKLDFPWYFANVSPMLAWPWHAVELASFPLVSIFYISKERGENKLDLVFPLLVSLKLLLLKSIYFLISILRCAGRYSCVLSTFRLAHSHIIKGLRCFYIDKFTIIPLPITILLPYILFSFNQYFLKPVAYARTIVNSFY